MRTMLSKANDYLAQNRARRIWMRVLFALACVVVFCTTYALILPAITLEWSQGDKAVTLDASSTHVVVLRADEASAQTDYVDLATDEHITLQLSAAVESCQWQVWSPQSSSWLNVYGDTSPSCEVYNAKLSGVLSSDGTASVRAVASSGGVQCVSDTLVVTVREADRSAQEVSAEPVVLSVGSEPLGDVSNADAQPEAAGSVVDTAISYIVPSIASASEIDIQDGASDVGSMSLGEENNGSEEPAAGGENATIPEPSEPEPSEPADSTGPTESDGPSEPDASTPTVPVDDQLAVDDRPSDGGSPANELEPTDSNADPVGGESVGSGGQGASADNSSTMGINGNGISSTEAAADANAVLADNSSADAGEDESTEGSDVTRYTVHVYYVYENNVQAADPWWATFSATGETGGYEVEFPEIEGYRAYLNGEEATSMHLPDTITGDTDYTVVYKPTEVAYAVRHWWQDLGADTYMLYETEEKKALTGTQITDAARSYEGFTAAAYEYPSVAGDGSTTVDIYYDRNYYQIVFDLDGGTGVSDIYVQYGTELNLGDLEPTKTGYTFDGWYADANYAKPITDFPSTMPAENKTYYAKWNGAVTNYTVAVWLEDLEEGQYSFLDSKTFSANSGVYVDCNTSDVKGYLEELAAKEGSELKYFSLSDNGLNNGVTVVADGSSILNVYYDRNSYMLRFVYQRSSTDGWGRTTYQISSSNHGYSLHQFNQGVGMTGTDLTTGCNWQTRVTGTAGFTDTYQQIIDDSNGKIKTGTFDERGYTYYYIDVTAKYGEELLSMWPQAGTLKWSVSGGGERSLIDWGTEYDSLYRKTYAGDGSQNAEPNIHPYYGTLDEMLIVRPEVTAERGPTHVLVAYTSGDTVYDWRYTFYYEALQGQTGTVGHDGKQYVVVRQNQVVRTTQVDHGVDYVSVVGVSGFETPNVADNTLVITDAQGVPVHDQDNPQPDRNGIYYLSLYYDRDKYAITFDNGHGQQTVVDGIPFGESLDAYVLEDGTLLSEAQPPEVAGDSDWKWKYEFSGEWYEAYNQATGEMIGEPFDFSTATMPQSNLVLYAKWVPKTYEATFYWGLPDSDSPNAGQIYTYPTTGDDGSTVPSNGVQEFVYGENLDEVDSPAYGQYEFLYWSFYVYSKDVTDENDEIIHKASNPYTYEGEGTDPNITDMIARGELEERRLSFDTTILREDADIFANWNSVVYVPYQVSYVLDNDTVVYDDDGNYVSGGIKIAETTNGSALAGSTVTVTAKAGDELYEGYQGLDENGLMCYPVGSSTHSIIMDIDSTGTIKYTFVYKKAEPIEYKVQYLGIEYGQDGKPVLNPDGTLRTIPLADSLVVTSTQAIVTENARDFEGYTLVSYPESGNAQYQQTLVLTYTESSEVIPENTITFYYAEDTQTKNYTVEYYTQGIDGTYELHTEMELPGAIGTDIDATELIIPGYWLNKKVEGTIASGKLEQDTDLVLKLYYSAYPLVVNKVWDERVHADDVKPVTVRVYKATQEGNSWNATQVEDSERELAVSTGWTTTLYLPALEQWNEDETTVVPIDNQSYFVIEDNALSAVYTDGTQAPINQQVFVEESPTNAGKVTLTTSQAAQEGQQAKVTITNMPAYELPSTGGHGTILFTIGGLLLMAGTVLCWLMVRRRQEGRAA